MIIHRENHIVWVARESLFVLFVCMLFTHIFVYFSYCSWFYFSINLLLGKKNIKQKTPKQHLGNTEAELGKVLLIKKCVKTRRFIYKTVLDWHSKDFTILNQISQWLKAVSLFYKTLHLRYFPRFWTRLWRSNFPNLKNLFECQKLRSFCW